MNIILIGSGHVASVFGRCMLNAGHIVTHCWSRTPAHAAKLAGILGAVAMPPDWNEWPAAADLVLFSVNDDAYAPLSEKIPPTDMLLVHTGGAVPGDVFARTSKRTGVLYPLQSIRSETEQVPELPLLISAARDEDLSLLENFAFSLSPLVTKAGDGERLKYHAAAVFTANFSNHLFALAESFCKKQGLQFDFLRPLLEETIHRMRSGSPAGLQTGPAIRGDSGTIEKHLLLLEDEPAMRAIYTLLSKSIMDFYS